MLTEPQLELLRSMFGRTVERDEVEVGYIMDTIMSSPILNKGTRHLYITVALEERPRDFEYIMGKLYEKEVSRQKNNELLELLSAFKVINDMVHNQEVFYGEFSFRNILEHYFRGVMSLERNGSGNYIQTINPAEVAIAIRELIEPQIRPLGGRFVQRQLVTEQIRWRRLSANGEWLRKLDSIAREEVVDPIAFAEEATFRGGMGRRETDSDTEPGLSGLFTEVPRARAVLLPASSSDASSTPRAPASSPSEPIRADGAPPHPPHRLETWAERLRRVQPTAARLGSLGTARVAGRPAVTTPGTIPHSGRRAGFFPTTTAASGGSMASLPTRTPHRRGGE